MNKIKYLLGIGLLTVGFGCTNKQEAYRLQDDQWLSGGLINGQYVVYSKKEVLRDNYRCDLTFNRTIDRSEMVLMDDDCDGTFDILQIGDKNPLYLNSANLNKNLLDEFNQMMKMAQQNKIPKYTGIPTEVKDATSKTIAQQMGIPLEKIVTQN